MIRKNIFCLLSIMLIIAACDQPTQSPTTPSAEELSQALENDKSAIAELISTYEEAIEKRDVAACAAMYAPNGVFLPNGSEPITGGNIQEWYATLVDTTITTNIDLKVQEIEVHHDWALARTENSGTSTQNGKSTDFRSKSFFLLARQEDGTWKVKTYAFDSYDLDDQ